MHRVAPIRRAAARAAADRCSASHVGAWPGAVHHARNAQRDASPPRRLSRTSHRALDRIAAGDAPGVDAQLSARASGVDTRRDGRRHAMPMHVPPRPQMAQEALSIGERQRLPDLLRERPQARRSRRARHRLPRHVLADDSRQRRADRRAAAVGSATAARRVRMPTRQQAAARDRMDRSGMSLIEQCDHRVDHRQAGADQQHGRAADPAPVKCLRRPRIGTPKW